MSSVMGGTTKNAPLLSTVISDILDVSEEAGQLYLPPLPYPGSQVLKYHSITELSFS